MCFVNVCVGCKHNVHSYQLTPMQLELLLCESMHSQILSITLVYKNCHRKQNFREANILVVPELQQHPFLYHPRENSSNVSVSGRIM